jgi:hypothetical protein
LLRQCAAALVLSGLGILPAAAQGLSPQVMALYPAEAGELAFVDLQAARRSPHYAQLKAQVLPENFRDLEAWADRLGVEFDKNVDRLSWVFVDTGDPANSDFAGLAEGTFYLDAIRKVAARSKLAQRTFRDATVYSLGENKRGIEFLLAFPDNARLVFGYRPLVEGILSRAAGGGKGLLDNSVMRGLMEEVNRRAPVWVVLDPAYTQLGIRQFLGEAANAPGAETLTQRIVSATVRLQLDRSLTATVGANCASVTDTLWLSGFLDTALFFQRQRLNESNPTLARVLSEARIERSGERLTLTLAIPEADLLALLQSRAFNLSF